MMDQHVKDYVLEAFLLQDKMFDRKLRHYAYGLVRRRYFDYGVWKT